MCVFGTLSIFFWPVKPDCVKTSIARGATVTTFLGSESLVKLAVHGEEPDFRSYLGNQPRNF